MDCFKWNGDGGETEVGGVGGEGMCEFVACMCGHLVFVVLL